jgi:hypothetical protein
MPEQVAVVNPGPTAEPAHRIPQLGVDERVDDDRGMSASAGDCPLQIVDGLGPRVAHFLERLLGKLGLERKHEPGGRLSCGVGDDVELDRRLGHPARG